MLTVTPVKKAKVPAYPNLREAAGDPTLLQALPRRWKQSRAMLAAMAALSAMGLSACSAEPAASADSSAVFATSSSFSGAVAPIFYHGEGTGSMGCVSVAPSVFFSEQEALAIIRSEVSAAGLRFADAPDSRFIAQPKIREELFLRPEDGMIRVKYGEPVTLDAVDEEKRVAISFVSMSEGQLTIDNGQGEFFTGSTVAQYEARRRAEDAAEAFQDAGTPYAVGVFYDPGNAPAVQQQYWERLEKAQEEGTPWETMEPDYEAYHEELRAASEKNLRAQVRDFLQWLEGQGIL